MKKKFTKVFQGLLVVVPLAITSLSLPLIIKADMQTMENSVFGGDESHYELIVTKSPELYGELSEAQAKLFEDMAIAEMKKTLLYTLPKDAVSECGMTSGEINISFSSGEDGRRYAGASFKNVNLQSGKADLWYVSVYEPNDEAILNPYGEVAKKLFKEQLDITIPVDYSLVYQLGIENNITKLSLEWQDQEEQERRQEKLHEFTSNGFNVDWHQLDSFFEERKYSYTYIAEFNELDLSAGTGRLALLSKECDTAKNAKYIGEYQVKLNKAQKEALLNKANQFADRVDIDIKSAALEGISYSFVHLEDGSPILNIVYRYDDGKRTVIKIDLDGSIIGYRNKISYSGGPYIVIEEEAAVFYKMAVTELKNKLNITLPENIRFDNVLFDPVMMQLIVTTNDDNFKVAFKNVNIDKGSGVVSHVSSLEAKDPEIRSIVKPLEEKAVAAMKEQLNLTLPSSYILEDISLYFNSNQTNLDFRWTDANIMNMSYSASFDSVDLFNGTGHITALGLDVNYAHILNNNHYSESQVSSMADAAGNFAKNIKLKTNTAYDSKPFMIGGTRGLQFTYEPEVAGGMQTVIAVTEKGKVISYLQQSSQPSVMLILPK